VPFDPARYPDDWREIADRVKTAAGWCCEQCGHEHDSAAGYMLTVHHIDGDPMNNEPWNLVALCQRCHLAIHGKKYLIRQLMFSFVQPSWLKQRLAQRKQRGDSKR
jgi:5-methylcytosine-specific restriction endonuclease McrA